MTPPKPRLIALIQLLADDHPEVVETVRTKLTEAGLLAVPLLKEAVDSHADSKVRVEARGVLERIRLVQVRQEWEKAAALPDDKLNLEAGAFLMARVGFPEMDPSLYRRRLDELAGRVQPRLAPLTHPRERLKALNRFLFEDERFRGNREDYFDPRNSYLNCVLDRKLGIPISLSVLYLLLAERLKLPVKGAGIPGHFMIQYKDPQTELYVDTFNGGRFLSRPECVQFMVESGFPYQVEFLQGVGPRAILARMLRNLILIYVDRHEETLEKTLTRFLDLLYSSIGDDSDPDEGGLFD